VWRQKPKSLARNNNPGVEVAHQHRRVPHFAAKPSINDAASTMNRDDVLVWLSLLSFVFLSGLTILVLILL